MAATGDNLTAAKAYAGAVCTALAPGAAWIAAQAQAGTVSGLDWLVAGCLVVAGGAVGGTVVYTVENKPKTAAGPPTL